MIHYKYKSAFAHSYNKSNTSSHENAMRLDAYRHIAESGGTPARSDESISQFDPTNADNTITIKSAKFKSYSR